MKKFTNVVLTVFGVGMTICLFAGGITILGYFVALFIGGDTAMKICTFIYKEYFPWVIKFSSIFTGFGLLGMYLKKMKALTVESEEPEAEAEESAETQQTAVETPFEEVQEVESVESVEGDDSASEN